MAGKVCDSNELVQFLLERSSPHVQLLNVPELPLCIWVHRKAKKAVGRLWIQGEPVFRVPVEEIIKVAQIRGKDQNNYPNPKWVCSHMGRFIE